MREIRQIIIHCAATPNGKEFTAADIDRWHGERNFNRRTLDVQAFNRSLPHIGYHFVIRLSGVLETGRAVSEVGAHAVPFNRHSIGVCMIGHDRFTVDQWRQLAEQVSFLCSKYGVPAQEATEANGWSGVMGHRDVPGVHKTCPGFSVSDWLRRGMRPAADGVLAKFED